MFKVLMRVTFGIGGKPCTPLLKKFTFKISPAIGHGAPASSANASKRKLKLAKFGASATKLKLFTPKPNCVVRVRSRDCAAIPATPLPNVLHADSGVGLLFALFENA